MIAWSNDDVDFIRRRYDRIGSLHKVFDWLLFLPTKLRRTAVSWIDLRAGDRVLEVGCGTGPNLPMLREAVGPHGRVYGVDLSEGMLAPARRCARNGWTNVSLSRSDAIDYMAPEPLDGVLFSLSYNTMPHHRSVLTQALGQVRPGGRVVIMDAKLPSSLGGKLVLLFSVWLMKCTVLGNPYIRPWEHLAPATTDFAMQEFRFGSYYVCRGSKLCVPREQAPGNRSAGWPPK